MSSQFRFDKNQSPKRANRLVKNLDKSTLIPDSARMATVILTSEALEQADELPKEIHTRVLTLVERLEKWPEVSGAKPLRGNLAGHFRMRTGDYRLRFHPKGDKVIVDKIGHRRVFYED